MLLCCNKHISRTFEKDELGKYKCSPNVYQFTCTAVCVPVGPAVWPQTFLPLMNQKAVSII